MDTAQRVLRILADGRFYSGEDLGRSAGVSRAAVWKAVRVLNDLGVRVAAVPGRGYRLAEPLELLQREAIEACLDGSSRPLLHSLEVHQSVGSTNAHLRGYRDALVSGHACLAEHQHAGRGRRGRQWSSPFGANIYLSVGWRYHDPGNDLSGLSLAMAVAVVRALRAAGVTGAGVKWPNDILWRGRKLAGVLVEAFGEAHGPWGVVVGVGLNVRMPAHAGAEIDQAWADLSEAAPDTGRNAVAGGLLHHVLVALEAFGRDGFEAFLDEWAGADCTAGRTVQLHGSGEPLFGMAQGVDTTGALLLDVGGRVVRCGAGEVTLRTAETPGVASAAGRA